MGVHKEEAESSTNLTSFANEIPEEALLDPSLPPYISVKRDSNLRENAKKMAGKSAELEKEFKMMSEHVKEKILKKSNISSSEKNKPHNRYLDIGKSLKLP